MLAWLVEEVESPYGSVATLHWAVPDGAADGANNVGDLNDTALQVELESAEDQLGAVLWNSNPAALAYLHTHVFRLPPPPPSKEGVGSCDPATVAATTTPSPSLLMGKNIVELGAGVGCLGIALAMAGARVAVTDMKELLPLMTHNVRLNEKRVQARSHGVGFCAALQWKWGPTVSTSMHKQLQKELNDRVRKHCNVNGSTDTSIAAAVEEVVAGMVESLERPSDSLVQCSKVLSAAGSAATAAAKTAPVLPYHYVIMCDALYGNPKDWPALLYTLTELLSTNPGECEIVNFCEQRVNDVEGAFLRLLEEENKRVYIPAAQRDAAGDPLWAAVRDSALRCCDAVAGTEKKGSAFASAAVAAATTTAQLHATREQAASALLNYVLVQRRGRHHWAYSTEVVAEAQSELKMVVRATRIRWVRVAEGEAALGELTAPSKSRRRPHEAEKSAPHPHSAAPAQKKKKQ
jgi:hypothetical protein